MNTPKSNKNLGAALCGFFGAAILSGLYNVYNIVFQNYNQIATIIIFLLVNLICCISIWYAAKFKENFNYKIGRIAALAMVVLYGLFAINNVTAYIDFPLFKFLGKGAAIILDSLMFVLVATFLFSSKTWFPIKIVGSIEYLVSIISCVFILELNNTLNIADETYDYSRYDSIISAINSCSYIILMINVVALILTIVWMNKRPIAPSIQNHKIDII